jgi:hypothetical protein
VRTATFLYLARLRARHGPRELGKVCQKFMALAFWDAGCAHVVERGVQGVDVDAAWTNEKYAAEIKTTARGRVSYQMKDAVGLSSRRQDGYRPLLAVLRLGAFAAWYFIDAGRLSPGVLDVESLRSYRRHDLEARLQPHFDRMVEEHFEGALLGGQASLDEVLRHQGLLLSCTARA